MIKINISENNSQANTVQSMRYQEEIADEIIRKTEEKIAVDSNVTAKREIASELMRQGFSDSAICRILNISPEQLPEPLPF
jgi:SOS response regulatory protein OraA/RecX